MFCLHAALLIEAQACFPWILPSVTAHTACMNMLFIHWHAVCTLALCECVISWLSWESIMFGGKTTFLPEASRLLCVTVTQLLLCCLIIWLLILITASWRNRRHFTAGSWIIMHQANKVITAMQHISSGFPLRTRASQRSLMKPSWHRQTACRCWTWATTCWMSILLRRADPLLSCVCLKITKKKMCWIISVYWQ